MIKKVQLGLKSSSDEKQVESRLSHHPDVYEFYTSEKDFTTDGLNRLKEAILEVKMETKQIILHHPMTYQKEFLELVVPQKLFPETYYFLEKSTNNLLQIAFDLDTQVLIHGSYELKNKKMFDFYGNWEKANNHLFNELQRYSNLGKERIMFENSISPLFYFGDSNYDQQIFDANIQLAFDVSHSFIKFKGNNNILLESLRRLKDHIVHYHLVDSMGEIHDSLPLGQGKIDWLSVYSLLNTKATSIYEIDLVDMKNPLEQLQSHQYILDLLYKFNVKTSDVKSSC